MRKISPALLIALPLLIVGATVFAAKKRSESTAVILASYPKSDAFTHYIKTHRDWVAAPNPKANSTSKSWPMSGANGLFYASSFESNGSYANQCTVNETGQVFTVRDVYNWALQSSNNFQLTKSETEKIRLALRKLPPNGPKPPLNQLLVLSFRAKKGKETRIYDRANLPTEVKTVYRLAHADLRLVEATTPPAPTSQK